jgi:hypothetical protein
MKHKMPCTSYAVIGLMGLFLSIFSIIFQIEYVNAETVVIDPWVKHPGSIWSVFAETTVAYDDNVFQLSESQKNSLDNPEQDDLESGRYADMESISDIILTQRLGFKLTSMNSLGGEIGMDAWLQYNAYMKNDKKSYFETEISLTQSMGDKGRLGVEFKTLNGCYRKNYLSAADDSNDNGNIARDERTYSPAAYDEFEGVVFYRHNFIKNKDRMLSRLDVEPFGGSSIRRYNDLFSNRDKRTATGGLNVRLGFLSIINLDVGYQFDRVISPGHSELVLFDETIIGIDVNNDGDIEGNAALDTRIDRSCNRHGIEITPSLELSDNLTVFAGYQWRISYYTSDNELDIDHYHRTVERHQFKADASFEMSKFCSASVEYKTTDEEEPDDDDYVENCLMLKLKCEM